MRKKWSKSEIAKLTLYYPDVTITKEKLQTLLGRHINSIHLKANRMGLKRDLRGVMSQPEIRAKISRKAKLRIGDRNPFYKRKHNPETITRMKKKLSIKFSGTKNPFFGRHHTDKTKVYLSKTRKGRFTGENNPAWRGGYKPYYGPNWSEQRRKVLARDNYRCIQCGRAKEGNRKELDVHHIIPFGEFGIEHYAEANREENLITLCMSCHRKKLGGGD